MSHNHMRMRKYIVVFFWFLVVVFILFIPWKTEASKHSSLWQLHGTNVYSGVPPAGPCQIVLVDQFTMQVRAPFSRSVNVTIGQTYYFRVSGTMSFLSGSCTQWDAFYYLSTQTLSQAFSCNYANSPSPANTPYPLAYNSSHSYISRLFTAGTNLLTFNFGDSYYNDNCGNLVFYVYQLVNYPVASINGLSQVCTGPAGSVYYTESGMSQYIWSVSSGGSVTSGGGSNDNAITVNWNSTGAQWVSVSYLDPGCSLGFPSASATPTVFPVTVKPMLTASIAANGPTSFCHGDSVILTASGGTRYVWSNSASTASVTVTESGIYTVSVSDVNGCSDVKTLPVIVHSLPVPTIAGSLPVCTGPPGKVFITQTGMGQYDWIVSGGSIIAGGSPGDPSISLIWDLTGVQWISVNYTDGNGCRAKNATISNVDVKPSPMVTFAACVDQVTSVDAKPFSLKGGLPLNGIYSGPGVSAGMFTPSVAGAGISTVKYTYVNAYGCTAGNILNIEVKPAPSFSCGSGQFTDVRDNASYPAVQIGTQCWLAVNLNYGSMVPSSQPQADNCVPEKYCYNNDPAGCVSFGGLYQWDEMMQYGNSPGSQGFCPPGWHVPDESDWNVLFSFYYGEALAGGFLQYHTASDFQALMVGVLYANHSWKFNDLAAIFWTSALSGSLSALSFGMNKVDYSVSRYLSAKTNAFPVRCLHD